MSVNFLVFRVVKNTTIGVNTPQKKYFDKKLTFHKNTDDTDEDDVSEQT